MEKQVAAIRSDIHRFDRPVGSRVTPLEEGEEWFLRTRHGRNRHELEEEPDRPCAGVGGESDGGTIQRRAARHSRAIID
jgi:hypothetical protein